MRQIQCTFPLLGFSQRDGCFLNLLLLFLNSGRNEPNALRFGLVCFHQLSLSTWTCLLGLNSRAAARRRARWRCGNHAKMGVPYHFKRASYSSNCVLFVQRRNPWTTFRSEIVSASRQGEHKQI